MWWSMGMSFFPSRHRCCERCCQRTVKVKGEEVVEYYHWGVVCYLVGAEVAVPLDVEMIQPGEGEVVAAKRLMERVIRCYGRFFDIVMGDALYLEAPPSSTFGSTMARRSSWCLRVTRKG